MSQIYLTEKILIRLLDWCYDHPDYAFFYATDHGGQDFFGEDNIINHGGNQEGNEAGFFTYSRKFVDEYQKLKLNDKIVSLYDFSTLIGQLIEGGIVPLESLGVPYPLANDRIFFISSVKAKGQQLINYIDIVCNKYPKNKNILKNLNDTVFDIYNKNDEDILNNTDKYLDKLRDLQNDIEIKLDENNKNKFFLVAFYFIVLFLGLLISYDIYTLKNLSFYKENNNNSKKNMIFYIIVIIFGIYFNLLFIIFYPSNVVYDKLFTSIINQYYSYSFLIICFILFNYKTLNMLNIIFYSSLSLILSLISFLSSLFYKYELFLKMKRLFTSLTLAKTFNFALFYPVFAFYMYREIKNSKDYISIQIINIPLLKYLVFVEF